LTIALFVFLSFYLNHCNVCLFVFFFWPMHCLSLCLFIFTTALFVLQCTTYDYPFGIFKLFLFNAVAKSQKT
jgi:hypothetical protein